MHEIKLEVQVSFVDRVRYLNEQIYLERMADYLEKTEQPIEKIDMLMGHDRFLRKLAMKHAFIDQMSNALLNNISFQKQL